MRVYRIYFSLVVWSRRCEDRVLQSVLRVGVSGQIMRKRREGERHVERGLEVFNRK